MVSTYDYYQNLYSGLRDVRVPLDPEQQIALCALILVRGTPTVKNVAVDANGAFMTLYFKEGKGVQL